MSHGLEPPEVRAAAGKPAVGTLSLDAELRGGALLLRVADDGAGVDLPDLRRRAVASNTVTREMAEALDDEALLTLLFVPGFTTRESADLLAGRGVGLDLTLAAIRRLGGTIRLTSRRGEGLSALLRIPVESGLVKVLWMRAGTMWYALPLQHVRRVDLTRDVDGPAPTPLAACLSAYPRSAGVRGSEPRALVVELDRVERAPTFPCRFTVDEVGIVEELAVRGLSALVTTAGPYAGAIVRGDDVRLCLDAHALSELLDRLRAPARAAEGAASERA
jgi:two-component system chemotaxis sensor kinase CheA